MNLSEIVRYRNKLDEISPRNAKTSVKILLAPFSEAVEAHPLSPPETIQELHRTQTYIAEGIDVYEKLVEKIKQDIDFIIESKENIYLSNSYRLHEGVVSEPTEYILQRRLSLSTDAENYIRSRIRTYSNWYYAGMIIRPGLETWVDELVGCDPLYFVDTRHDLLEPAKKYFTEQLLNRLRFNIIKESADNPMLHGLPDLQFGFIFAYNFLNYRPFDIIKNYLSDVYNKLMPGGVFGFTFNDCDRWGGVVLAEKCFMSYTPKRLIYGFARAVGFEVVNEYIIDNAVTWVELRKPGQRASLKGGQTLAKIIEKSK